MGIIKLPEALNLHFQLQIVASRIERLLRYARTEYMPLAQNVLVACLVKAVPLLKFSQSEKLPAIGLFRLCNPHRWVKACSRTHRRWLPAAPLRGLRIPLTGASPRRRCSAEATVAPYNGRPVPILPDLGNCDGFLLYQTPLQRKAVKPSCTVCVFGRGLLRELKEP